MAEHNTLKIGDTVTHPEWPEGSSATIIDFDFFRRFDGKKDVKDYGCRVAILDDAFDTGDGMDECWMEAGLERVPEA